MRVPQFYVRSNVHMTNLDSAINRLLVNESLIDVTLACDGHRFQCHRLVLAAASPLFEELLMEHPKEHPIVIIPIGVKWHILKSLIDFMYRGQTCINQGELKTLIESAELLKVIGLYDPQTQFREFYGEDDDCEENLNVDQQDCTVVCNNDDKEEEEEKEEEGGKVEDEEKLNHLPISNNHEICEDQESTHNQDQNEIQEIDDKNDENINENENNSDKSKEVIVDFIEIDDSQDEVVVPPSEEDKDCTTTKDQMTMTNEEVNEIPISNSNHTDKNYTEEDVTEVEETKLLESDILQNVPNLTITGKTTPTTTNETMPTIRVKPTIKLINLFKLNRPGQTDGNQSPSNVPWTYIHIPAPPGSNIQSPSAQVPLNSNIPTMTWPVNALPQLMPMTTTAVNAQPLKENNESTTAECGGVVPSFLKFNSSSMAISVKNLDRTKTREKLNVLNMALELESTTDQQQPVSQPESAEENEEEAKDQQDDDDEIDHHQESLELGQEICRIKQELDVKTELMDFDSDQDNNKKTEEIEAEAENIICQPNVSYIYDGHEYGKDLIEHVDDDEDGVCIDYDRLVAETYGNMQQNHPQKSKKKPSNKKLKKLSKVQLRTAENYNSMKAKYQQSASSLELANNQHLHQQRLKDPPTLVPLSVMNAGLGPKHLYYHHNKKNKNNNSKIDMNDEKIDNGFSKMFGEPTTMAELPDSHTQNAVILRNPRCNQPRHYSNESLYAALMAVKYGDSIYRASRLHQVPRKTLRNWMKRWDIKSQYPMPKQLKDAAKKKKLIQNQSSA